MKWKASGRKRSWYNRGINIPAFSSRTKNITEDGRCPGRDSNRAPIKYKSQALPLNQTAWWPWRESSRDFLSNYTDWTIRVRNELSKYVPFSSSDTFNLSSQERLKHDTLLSPPFPSAMERMWTFSRAFYTRGAVYNVVRRRILSKEWARTK
jgi:hypothetical protein